MSLPTKSKANSSDFQQLGQELTTTQEQEDDLTDIHLAYRTQYQQCAAQV